MHRHAYQGKKLSRDRDQRVALLRGQITSLVLYERIETTLAKAKAVAPEFDRLITKAKRATLADQRAIRQVLTAESAAQKLMREVVPALGGRSSGYTQIIKTGNRRGDNAPMAVIQLIDRPKPQTAAETKAEGEQPEPVAKPTAKAAPKRTAKAGAKS